MRNYQLLGLPLTLGLILFGVIYFFFNTPQSPKDDRPEPTATSTQSTPEPIDLMSTEEKIGQLIIAGHWADTSATSTKTLIDTYHLGGIIIMSAPDRASEIENWTALWQTDRETPLRIGIDQEGGVVSRLKGESFIQTAEPDIHSIDQAYQVGYTRGTELHSLGINLNFAPVLETSVNPNGFLYDRTFRPPAQIVNYGRSMIRGLQTGGVTAVAKHYPGHEDEPADSHVELPTVELAGTTFGEHTHVFNELIADDTIHALMTAHVLVPSIDPNYPATLSKTILTDTLRDTYGYTGVIITDDLVMQAIAETYTPGEAAVLAIEAGADMVLLAAEPEKVSEVVQALSDAVAANRITEQRLDESVRRILKLK